ncbi:RTA1 like protein-domain-containing protein [Cyathus striatus]|nr:RTA1 like protein-domain-containing protein [Cyathus striatus]
MEYRYSDLPFFFSSIRFRRLTMSYVNGLLFARGADLNSPYNYDPTKYVAIIMVILFSISTAVHTGQALYFRLWWLLPTACLCGTAELIGWGARLWSSISPLLDTPFKMQIALTIIAPTPLVAANFIILGRLISRLGPQYSRLSPKWYTIIFCSCDVVSLVIQGVGGGLAASADTPSGAVNGAHIMLGGIVFQLVAIVVYALLAMEFFLRYLHDKPVRNIATHFTSSRKPIEVRGEMTRRLQLMSGALIFSTLSLFIRAVYRTIELSDGWNGRIISTEVYFNVLDGAMVILAMYTVNILHPGVLLSEVPSSDASSGSTVPVEMSHI